MRRLKRSKSLFKPFILIAILGGFIFFVPPENILYFAAFYILLFTAIWQILQTFFDNKKSLVYTIIIITYLLLRQNKIDNILNVILLAGLFVALEIYFRMS